MKRKKMKTKKKLDKNLKIKLIIARLTFLGALIGLINTLLKIFFL